MAQNEATPAVTDSLAPDSRPTIRTVTAFLTLRPKTFDVSWGSLFSTEDLDTKVAKCVTLLRETESKLKASGYTVQTVRIATNPFGEWLVDDAGSPANHDVKKPKKARTDVMSRLERLDTLLANHNIDFCSVGPATCPEEAERCIDIIGMSHRFSCSKVVEAGDVESANIAASTIMAISKLGDKPNAPKHVQHGLGNFRFCSASYCRSGIPFFPAAKAAASTNEEAILSFAIGLENGPIAQRLLRDCHSIQNIATHFKDAVAKLLEPVQSIAKSVANDHNATFLGIDSSLNPSLDSDGSVAAAIEELEEVNIFGGPGTLAAAAEITKALQSLPGIDLTGYCGLMLPVCEDTRLAELSRDDQGGHIRRLRVSDVLSVSSVCGVGVDTVPVPGDCSKEQLSSLILDVAGIAGRWNKSLSCRVFPVPGKKAGDMTEFDSPYMVNACIFSLD